MAAIPTRVVKYRGGNGADVIINTSDFDPEKHIPVGEAEAPKAPGHPADLDSTPGTIATVNGDKALDLVAEADSVAELDALEKAEKASQRHPGGRKGVLRAIADRREDIR